MNTPETGQDDITKRLRDTFDRWNNPPSPELPDGAGVLLEAADAIELLRTALRQALEAKLTEF